jgi:hypothetical protein
VILAKLIFVFNPTLIPMPLLASILKATLPYLLSTYFLNTIDLILSPPHSWYYLLPSPPLEPEERPSFAKDL